MKKPYNKLTKEDKEIILNFYYHKDNIDKTFKEMALNCNVSARAFSRVLRENNVNTKLKNRYTLDENYFENIDTEEKAYWLGLLYADGYVGDSNYNNIIISLTIIDIELLKKFKKSIKFSGEIRIDTNAGGFSNGTAKAVLNFSSNKMASDLRKLGLYPGKSQSMKGFPDLKDDLIRHFIRGYFDGDGGIFTTYEKKTNRTRFVCSIIGTIDFIKELKDNVPIKLTRANCKSDNMEYAVCNVNERLLILYDYFYKDSSVYMERKFNKWNEIIGAIKEKSLIANRMNL